MMSWMSFCFPDANGHSMESTVLMHDYVLIFLLSIMVLVMVMMWYLTFSKSFSFTFFENHMLEFNWTVLPAVLLICIAYPSIETLYTVESCDNCGFSIQVTGHQWFWVYSLSDIVSSSFSSYMSPADESIIRLLDVDNRLAAPSLTPLQVSVTSNDVLHSWTIPSLGVKMDAIPGRLNQYCVTLPRPGIFFGQCSELCGAGHSFMPIVMEVYPMEIYSSFFLIQLLGF